MRQFLTPAMRERCIRAALLGTLFLTPHVAGAAKKTLDNIYKIGCTIFNWTYTFALVVGITCAVIAAFKYMTAGGDSSKVSEAHKTLLYATVGIAVALMAVGVPNLVATILDVTVKPC